MKKFSAIIFIILTLIVGIPWFSLHAVSVADDRKSIALTAQMNEAAEKHETNLKSSQNRLKQLQQDRRRLYNQLLEEFPGEDNKEAIDAIFFPEDEDESETE